MFKSKRLSLALATMILSTFIGLWIVRVDADSSFVSTDADQISKVIESYFEARYRSFNNLQLEDFSELVDASAKGSAFLHSESDKLDIEIYHAQLEHLQYVEYEFFLEFKDISIDTLTQTATVSVIEGHDVIFEVAKPNVSSMRNLKHTISMQKKDGVWKIVADDYQDYLWRLINATGQSKKDLLRIMDNAYTSNTNDLIIAEPLPLSQSAETYPYNRNGAVDYAQEWATAPRPYNTKYDDFTDYGGDCTNFVSQALHEGGGAPMVFGGTHGVAMPGWYYFNVNDRALAWVWVDSLYNLIVNEHALWDAGLEGHETVKDYVRAGDVIQYDWATQDGVWDHSVIIVDSIDTGYGDMMHYVAGHSPDVDNYPFSSFAYNEAFRFLSIDLVKGYRIYLPLVVDGNAMPSSMQNLPQNPYPAPMESNKSSLISPYPAP